MNVSLNQCEDFEYMVLREITQGIRKVLKGFYFEATLKSNLQKIDVFAD